MNREPSAGSSVLIVEDNRDAADSLAEYLRLNGFDVRVEYTGPAGLATALAEHPNAVICDINLPGLNGFSVARGIRDGLSIRPVLIAVTAWREQDLVRPAGDAGFDYYFVKPADPVEICGFLCDSIAGKVPCRRLSGTEQQPG
jgi:DNA-binding response OmpR family regulator